MADFLETDLASHVCQSLFITVTKYLLTTRKQKGTEEET
jgi:hypothetical protein